MLTKNVQQALNDQIRMELNSAYTYLGMSAHCEHENLPGFAAWLRRQAAEEQEHAMRIFEFINSRDGKVILSALDQPPSGFGTPGEVFEQVLVHERSVTASIHSLYDLAISEKDYATQSHLQWFINEQVEEEKTASDILEQVKVVQGHKHLLLGMDRRIGQQAAEHRGE